MKSSLLSQLPSKIEGALPKSDLGLLFGVGAAAAAATGAGVGAGMGGPPPPPPRNPLGTLPLPAPPPLLLLPWRKTFPPLDWLTWKGCIGMVRAVLTAEVDEICIGSWSRRVKL
jgi:hypothetical protein